MRRVRSFPPIRSSQGGSVEGPGGRVERVHAANGTPNRQGDHFWWSERKPKAACNSLGASEVIQGVSAPNASLDTCILQDSPLK